MSRILSVSSSRADVGALAPVWQALAATEGVELHVFLTGMHVVDDGAARAMLPEHVTIHSGGADLGGASPAAAVEAMSQIQNDAARLFADIRPDLVLVMGDRLDMLPAATAALPFNIGLVHLHGGEVTEGAVDDRIRNALSKLSDIHCVSTQYARRRLLAMGIDDAKIHVTGAPGLDTLKAAPAMSREAFAHEAGLDGVEGDLATLRLVTVHSETNAADPLAPVNAVLGALEQRPAPSLFTAPNSDPGGTAIRSCIEDLVVSRPWARFRDTLGASLYANALHYAAIMVGNSSSGIIEAGLFGLPVINVGDRQKGRERGSNVTEVPSDTDAILHALDCLGPVPPRAVAVSPYGDGMSGPRVAKILASAISRTGALLMKSGSADGKPRRTHIHA